MLPCFFAVCFSMFAGHIESESVFREKLYIIIAEIEFTVDSSDSLYSGLCEMQYFNYRVKRYEVNFV